MNHESSGSDTVEFWNEVWDTVDFSESGHDALLESVVSGLMPGRALDIGCGAGGNVMWLAERGWLATGVDFSEVAVQKARQLASSRGLDAEFIAADASTYRPSAQFQLITSFYIQLPPEQRRRMLSNASDALAPGGRLMFVSHDVSAPPSGWNENDLNSLTTTHEIVEELKELEIERAEVVGESGAHMTHMPDQGEEHDPESQGFHSRGHCEGAEAHHHGGSTVVVAVKPPA